MELVRGIPITQYCDENRLTPRERLELFVSVCGAIQHAHQKGIIHRDIKPTNVLVTLHDGTPVVKVIDFGVAKAIDRQLSERSLFTNFAQIVGTPLYMSPEQAELSGLDVDMRSDIYSLGVLLYELLTGTTPFDKERLREAAFDEIRRIIREEEPPKPSTKISTLGETLTSVSAERRTESKKLTAQVRGDLDWIVMKALEKDRSRRYETANGFAADVQRYLDDQAIEARPPSAIYRFGKFARRNRVAVITTTLVATALLLGTAVSTTLAIWAMAERRTARDALHHAMDGIIKLGEEAQHAQQYAEAERLYKELLPVQLREMGPEHPDTLKTTHYLASAVYAQGREEEALRLLEPTLRLQREVLGEEAADTQETATTLAWVWATFAWDLSIPSDATPDEYARAKELAARAVELGESTDCVGLSTLWWVLAWTQYRCGDMVASRSSLERCLKLAEGCSMRKISRSLGWILLALLAWADGDRESARDYFLPLCTSLEDMETDWGRDSDGTPERWKMGHRRMKREVALVLGFPQTWSPADWSSGQRVEEYSRLIQRHPPGEEWRLLRGSEYGRLRKWKEAVADFAWVAARRPGEWRTWEAWGATCLEMGDREAYDNVCRRAIERFRDSQRPYRRMDLVVLCCLGPSKSADRNDLDKIAHDALLEGRKSKAFLLMGSGMAAYRCGRVQEALDLIPEGGFNVPAKDEVLALLFRAMARQKLGQMNEARQLLEQARREIQRRILPLDGPSLPYQHRPVVWCMVHPVLREAEALIEPSGKGDSSNLCEAPEGPSRQIGPVPFSQAHNGNENDRGKQ